MERRTFWGEKMTYEQFKSEFASRGYVETPLVEHEFRQCMARFEDSDYIIGIGCDVGCGVEFYDAWVNAEIAEEFDNEVKE